MKIERTPMSSALITDASRPKIAKQGAEAAPASVVSNISLDQSNSADDIDMAKVESVKLAISEGRYEINADRIAEGLIASMRDWS